MPKDRQSATSSEAYLGTPHADCKAQWPDRRTPWPIAVQTGTSLVAPCSRWMETDARQLRHHADHCRELANGPCGYRMRTILLTMAHEFDGQARDADRQDSAFHD